MMSETKKLIQYGLYNREQVCNILAPNVAFTPKSGTWGLHGLIRITSGQSNFVLFVTLGAMQAGYQFNETINNVGEFEWHTQPSLKLEDLIVKELINHDSYKNNIFVFFRPTAIKKEYIFLGHAKYVRHNENKEMPVRITWKVIEWNNDQFLHAQKLYETERNTEEDSFSKWKEVGLEQLKLSVRLYNCLKRASIHTLYDLANVESSKLLTLRNLGAKSYTEVLSIIEKCIVKVDMPIVSSKEKKQVFDGLSLSLRARHVLEDNGIKTENALALITKETISNFKNSGTKTNTEIMKAINFLLENNVIARAEYINTFILKIHADYHESKVEDVFTSAIAEQLKSQSFILIKDLINAGVEKLMNLRYHLNTFVSQLKTLEKSMYEFISSELLELLKNKSKSGKVDSSFERNKKILNNRSADKTLEECGSEFGLTRERVRQLERKFLSRAKNFANSNSVMLFLKSKFYSQSYLFRDNFANILNELSNLLLFILVNNEVENFHIIDEYDMLIVGDNWYEKINGLFELFPEIIKEEEIYIYKNMVISELKKENIELLSVHCDRIFEIEYKKEGLIYSKTSMNSVAKVNTILQTYFQSGIEVYEERDLKKFRKLYADTFNGEELSLNNRALTSRLINKCMLIDRGVYAPKQEKYLSNELVAEIDKFIQSQQRGIIAFGHLFSVFEESLKDYGIKNRYFLQGVLKEAFAGKYFTRRDYLTKTKEEFSYYDEICNYVCQSDIPLTKEDIQKEFPGVSEIVVLFAVANPAILNLFGSYLHISKVDICDEEIAMLKRAVEVLLSDNMPHNALEIMDKTEKSLKYMYVRTGIDNKTKIYSLLQALFCDEYQFKRPFLARHGVEMLSGKEMLKEYVYSFDELLVENIQDYAKENRILIYSIVDLIDTFNDAYLFKDKHSIIANEKVQIGEEILYLIERIIEDELIDKEFAPLTQVEGLHKLPKINYPWNEWLLYSIIKKYISKFEMVISDGQFRYAKPVVCKKGTTVDCVRNAVGRLPNSQKDMSINFGEVNIDKEFLDCLDLENIIGEEE